MDIILFPYQITAYVLGDFLYWLSNEAWKEGESRYNLFINQEVLLVVMPPTVVFIVGCTALVIGTNAAFLTVTFIFLIYYTGYDIKIMDQLEIYWLEF